MRRFLLAAALLFGTPALAEDFVPSIKFVPMSTETMIDIAEAEGIICETGKNRDGYKIEAPEVEDSCWHWEEYSTQLAERGYCKAGTEWKLCK